VGRAAATVPQRAPSAQRGALALGSVPTEFIALDYYRAHSPAAASPALHYGKVQRGGMGTGMPNWGPILTDQQTWAVVAYLWTFQFAVGPDRK